MSQQPELTQAERDERLYQIFEYFAMFGVSRIAASGSDTVLIDSARLAKLFRDLNLFDKSFNSIALDINFSKAKATFQRPDRKLPWAAFIYALQLSAANKYPKLSEEEAFSKLVHEIIRHPGPDFAPDYPGGARAQDGAAAPVSRASRRSSTMPRRTSAESNDSGIGESAGESSGSFGSGSGSLSRSRSLTRSRSSSSGTSFSAARAPSVPVPPIPRSKSPTRARMSLFGAQPSGDAQATPATGARKHQLGSADFVPTVPVIPRGSVFDRLTNPRGYTGTHKERFDADGRGKGKAGRVETESVQMTLSEMVKRF
ncbi:hypothetical protein BCR44DRAFT_398630 [Catenaria anguillulae PL171]|uniref:Uncharacterized protein n=1 Tax=Catenaria anguillulae PL171 TaxID=765915 RepID=A0A1Y2HJR7_9FUNG|nr:hypothetical protein BCR44DRAFT_398630 [Catenaria anguillulae PL171]